MNKNSNTYVILYSAIMVILVAVGLAFTSELLKDRQKANANIDTMKQILRSVHLEDQAADDAEAVYAATITEAYLIDREGNIIPGTEGTGANDPAFQARIDRLLTADQFPVFIATIDGEKKHIVEAYGAGLWGPIWGYIALNDDGNTIYGATMDNRGETPGLGAEISTKWFQDEFTNKQIFRDGEFKSIAVVKPGKSVSDRDYVDGVSGGTITSNGVQTMLYESLGLYEPYLKNLQK